MSEQDRQKWDAKYRAKANASAPAPPEWLVRHLSLLPHGRALDLASGQGEAAIELARGGWDVTAIDISEVGLRAGAGWARQLGVHVNWVVADLEEFCLPPNRFDVVTVFYYLDRRRLPAQIVESLRPGGMLVYETFTLDQLHLSGNHLTNPDHLLRSAELLTIFSGLRVRGYREVTVSDRAIASVVAERIANW